eukprot:scaffold211001_cov62-Attheya_sp.AAC.5
MLGFGIWHQAGQVNDLIGCKKSSLGYRLSVWMVFEHLVPTLQLSSVLLSLPKGGHSSPDSKGALPTPPK